MIWELHLMNTLTKLVNCISFMINFICIMTKCAIYWLNATSFVICTHIVSDTFLYIISYVSRDWYLPNKWLNTYILIPDSERSTVKRVGELLQKQSNSTRRQSCHVHLSSSAVTYQILVFYIHKNSAFQHLLNKKLVCFIRFSWQANFLNNFPVYKSEKGQSRLVGYFTLNSFSSHHLRKFYSCSFLSTHAWNG